MRVVQDITSSLALDDDLLVWGENLAILPRLPDGAFDMVYIDPPFNTGHDQVRATLRAVADPDGERTGFAGRRYRTEEVGRMSYADRFDDLPAYLAPRLREARRLLADHGTLYVHLDPRESHYVKVLLDETFGRECFLNELIWAYDYGAKARRRWPAKHDVILVYVKDPDRYWFDDAEVDREPYMSPGLVTPEQRARGKRPTDVWWHTIVPTSGHERTGYPTQKPAGIVRRMVTASSRPGGWCLDFFAGSGTLGAVARELDRRFVLVDASPEAVEVCERRLGGGATPGSQTPAAR
ncbi:MAG TPA: site-specific DNA-methyltransferase [Baekduia sp.]|uniref:DNA-methyltransferase n=1 Tax=Baekduia sp. TaxID=2600305 RepID=UPI002C97227D|nr:site-specific DNA-methyltransferase [Baekduia sp.]HMJ37384.1 site-specific DNA-methyltransferase [Baekduia sp.]